VRRHSPDPRYRTRAQLETELKMTATELDTLDRQQIITSSVERTSGSTKPVLYTDVDVAVAAVALSAFRFGIRGRHLRAAIELLRSRDGRLTPGWSGFAVFDPGGVELLEVGSSFDRHMFGFRFPTTVLIVPVTVPIGGAGDAR
jgi:hypothetical protein